ncbi:MAG: sigma-70 family RNA polymerase sigma factor [Lachnospiraceae bacterium]|nr:sigma-70 family RNA polymerase sigma factor [Lachnospiraceae bacterium]MDD6191753.1 sigma-70 family RNA polymerase sigma factor [Lachnospiraceae bacterium]MDY4793131.1 sigma-70 family RNA polymerase sigma factor [Pararoseburia sp.]
MKDYQLLTDEEVVAAYRAGDFEAVEYICNKYRGLVSKYGKKFFIKGGEEQDVIQEGMVGLFKAIQDYNENKQVPFKKFAEICITRQIIKAMESADRQKNQPLNSYVSFSAQEEPTNQEVVESLLTNEVFNPENILIDSEKTLDTFEKIVEILSKMELQVFLYMMQGMDYHTIAQKMDKSEKKIDNAIQRIRQKVRQLIV